MANKPRWYRQSLYEQAWENYRNEDDNYRSTVTQYLVFTATIVYAATQAKAATSLLGIVGLFLSLVTALYLVRITRYSLRWIVAKDDAIGKGLAAQELSYGPRAKEKLGLFGSFSAVPGYVLMFAIPVAGAILFILMVNRGATLWGN